MSDGGWIRLYRNIQEHWVWDEKPFDKRSAWIDMLLMANHQDNKFLLGNELIEVRRGSFITSELKLMDRWGWSKAKVRAFLSLLQNDNMIQKNSDKKKTTLTIVNYSVYQYVETTEKPQKNHEETTDEPQKDTNKNDKNVKNDKKYISSTEDRGKDLPLPPCPYKKIMELFNSICTSLPRIEDTDGNRQKTLKARWREKPDLQFWQSFFERVERSDFLTGRSDRWHNCCFDWIIKASNFKKINEGNYSYNKGAKSNGGTGGCTGKTNAGIGIEL